MATFGLVVCCLAVTVAGLLVVVELYTSFYGINPLAAAWDATAPLGGIAGGNVDTQRSPLSRGNRLLPYFSCFA
jgi:hypothetical protein